jgi:hypothetical protein
MNCTPSVMFVDPAPPPILALVPCILACRRDTFCGAHTFWPLKVSISPPAIWKGVRFSCLGETAGYNLKTKRCTFQLFLGAGGLQSEDEKVYISIFSGGAYNFVTAWCRCIAHPNQVSSPKLLLHWPSSKCKD